MSDFNKELIIDLFKQRDELKRENEALKKRIQRLEDSGDYLCAAAAFMGWHDKIEEWNKANG